MPIYDMQCIECNKVYEITMKISEYDMQKSLLTCQECHGNLKQKVHQMTFNLKGSGWFAAADTGGRNGLGTGYEITQRELNENLEMEKRLENDHYNRIDRGEE